MSLESRSVEILRSVDEMMRRITRWVTKTSGGAVVPEDVKLAIESTALNCESGSVPSRCRDLAEVGVPRLMEELRGYSMREEGKVRLESGAPGPSFWGAVKAVVTMRVDADAPPPERLEPVAVLLEQGVTYEQIARHIYGRRGVGPFIQANGAPDVGLIEKEAREPGSVIGEDWIPPWHEESIRLRRQEIAEKLNAFDRMENATHYDDPATVEDLLREGAFVQQIQRAKGVTRDVVLSAAREIGVKAVDGPGFPVNSSDEDVDDGFEDEEDPDADWKAHRHALRNLVIEQYTKSDGSKRAAEIVAEMRQMGHDVTIKSVATIIARWKKRQVAQTAVSCS